jgi:hypothetical protein
MDFGFTLKPDHTIERTLALSRQAEAAGFSHGWLFDSHVLWRDPYPLLTLMAGVTTSLRLGTCVTNPATREPSVTASSLAVLDEISGGRMDLGIGRGDSARRVLGKPPTTMAHLEEAILVIRSLVEGRSVMFEGTELRLPWTGSWRLPVWVAGYGPMDQDDRPRRDGIILRRRSRPSSVGSSASFEAAAGRPRSRFASGSRRPRLPHGPRVGARTNWFPALVSNPSGPRQQVPTRAAPPVPDRLYPGPTGYATPPRRGRLSNAASGDERGILRVPAGPGRAHRQTARAGCAGVDQFNLPRTATRPKSSVVAGTSSLHCEASRPADDADDLAATIAAQAAAEMNGSRAG